MENIQDIPSSLGKLERCCARLNYFKSKIDSYLYEPSTKALFETKAYLNEKIRLLAAANETLLNYIKTNTDLLPDQYRMVNRHIKELYELEFDVMEYTLKTSKYII